MNSICVGSICVGRMAVNRQSLVDRGLVGGRIKERRKAMQIRQEDLAEALGVDQTTVSRWEDGSIAMSVDDLGRVAHQLKKHITWFLRPREPEELGARNPDSRAKGQRRTKLTPEEKEG